MRHQDHPGALHLLLPRIFDPLSSPRKSPLWKLCLLCPKTISLSSASDGLKCVGGGFPPPTERAAAPTRNNSVFDYSPLCVCVSLSLSSLLPQMTGRRQLLVCLLAVLAAWPFRSDFDTKCKDFVLCKTGITPPRCQT